MTPLLQQGHFRRRSGGLLPAKMYCRPLRKTPQQEIRIFPEWIQVTLSPEEEKEVEERNRIENLKILSRAIDDAKKVFEKKNLKIIQSDVLTAAIALFERQASHNVYAKEAKCKEKFDSDKV